MYSYRKLFFCRGKPVLSIKDYVNVRVLASTCMFALLRYFGLGS